MEEKELQALADKVTEAAKVKITDATKDLATKAELEELKKQPVMIGDKKAEDIIKAQGEEITNLKEALKGKTDANLSVREQIMAWQETNKSAIEAIVNGEKRDLPPIAIKVPATMTIAGSLNSSAYLPNVQVLPGYVDLVRLQPTFWSQLRKGRVRANPLVWVNKYNKQGAATFIGEGVLKAQASFELQTQTSTPKKVAEHMKVSTEMLYDVDYLETMITEELRYEVEIAANTAVLTGTASATSPAGITTIASAFNLTTLETTNPTIFDVIRACIAQIRSLNFTGVITAYMNPIDMAEMDMEKATDSGVYMLPPFVSQDGTLIKGVRVIEENSITAGNVLVGIMDLYKIGIHEEFRIAWGWENDDFTKNLITVIGEMRFHQWFSSNHTGAWIYDSIDDIKSAITAA